MTRKRRQKMKFKKMVKRIVFVLISVAIILLACYLFYTGSRLEEMNNSALEVAAWIGV